MFSLGICWLFVLALKGAQFEDYKKITGEFLTRPLRKILLREQIRSSKFWRQNEAELRGSSEGIGDPDKRDFTA